MCVHIYIYIYICTYYSLSHTRIYCVFFLVTDKHTHTHSTIHQRGRGAGLLVHSRRKVCSRRPRIWLYLLQHLHVCGGGIHWVVWDCHFPGAFFLKFRWIFLILVCEVQVVCEVQLNHRLSEVLPNSVSRFCLATMSPSSLNPKP